MNISILNINQSQICYFTSPSIWTSEYYKYCLRLMIDVLGKTTSPINIIFGDINYNFQNSNRTLKIDIQSEHTLVKLGGRSVDEIIYGNIDHEDGKYLIRIPNYDYYSQLDATIEYSLPNIENLKTNNYFYDYLKDAIYIAPIIYDSPDFVSNQRTETITLGNNSDRRMNFAHITNIQNIIFKDDLKKLYNKTKIMVNIHQTDHHHTFEELRVLPALCNGVIIVSEDVPLEKAIPYSDSIIWSSYKNLDRAILEVQNNYEYYHNMIFTKDLEQKIIDLKKQNIENLFHLLV